MSYSLFWLSCLLYDEGCGSRTAVPSALYFINTIIMFPPERKSFMGGEMERFGD